jgi:hypothetical protein
MSEMGLDKKGGHALPDGKSAPLVITSIDAGVPTSGNPGNGDISASWPERADNSTGVTSPVSSGPIK